MSTSGVMLINLGSPAAPTTAAVKAYLRQFLSDPCVVELPKPLWQCLLRGLVLPLRSPKSAALYRSIWCEQGSPLVVESQALTDALADRLGKNEYQVALGMTYGSPSVPDALSTLRDGGVQELLLLPLFPQYSGASTAAAIQAVKSAMKSLDYYPDLRVIDQYHDFSPYIDALAASVQEHWQQQGRANKLLISFHGMPQRRIDRGDPYHQQCCRTANLLAERLQLKSGDWELVFQSRFGFEKWLRPYLRDRLKALPQEGIRSVDVIAPGFSVDCLETLEEIQSRNKAVFLASGGIDFRYIPALNASNAQVELLVALLHARAGVSSDIMECDSIS